MLSPTMHPLAGRPRHPAVLGERCASAIGLEAVVQRARASHSSTVACPDECGDAAVLRALAVRATCRRQKYGRALVKYIVHAYEVGVSRMYAVSAMQWLVGAVGFELLKRTQKPGAEPRRVPARPGVPFDDAEERLGLKDGEVEARDVCLHRGVALDDLGLRELGPGRLVPVGQEPVAQRVRLLQEDVRSQAERRCRRLRNRKGRRHLHHALTSESSMCSTTMKRAMCLVVSSPSGVRRIGLNFRPLPRISARAPQPRSSRTRTPRDA